MTRRIFSILYWSFLGLSVAVLFLVAVAIWLVTAPFDPKRRVSHMYSCAWAYIYVALYPGWTLTVENRRRIEHGKPYVLVANHTSVADIVLCFALFRQFKWVSKRSVFNLPFLGWNMWLCRYVPLVRGDAASIERMLETCRSWLRRDISVMMFPEGTRSEDGQVKPFKHGAFTLAIETGASVVPVVIHGGAELIPKHGRTFAAKAKLRVEVLEPIPPDGFESAAAYGEAVRQRIRKSLGQPVEEPERAEERRAGVPASTGAVAAT